MIYFCGGQICGKFKMESPCPRPAYDYNPAPYLVAGKKNAQRLFEIFKGSSHLYKIDDVVKGTASLVQYSPVADQHGASAPENVTLTQEQKDKVIASLLDDKFFQTGTEKALLLEFIGLNLPE
jgi:hypothetical protein